MNKWNLSEISLKNRQLVWYFVFTIFLGGIFSYFSLGRMEDPAFRVREMVITTLWPGASASEVEEQVTDKLEKKFQDIQGLESIKSASKSGLSVIYLTLKGEMDEKNIRPTWKDVKNLGDGIKESLPKGTRGPYYNDRFDDVYGTIFALVGKDYSEKELYEEAKKIRRLILRENNVQKVIFLGVQEEKIYLEIDLEKLSSLKIPPTAIMDAIGGQNEKAPSAMLETQSDNIYLRVAGTFENLQNLQKLPLEIHGQIFYLGDFSQIKKGYKKPKTDEMHYMGEKAVGIAVSMEEGGNILTLGKNLDKLMLKIKKELPLGMEIHTVLDQSKVVEASIGDFIKTLLEAIVIVLAVSFLSLGIRVGMVVACSIPLVLTGVFLFMEIFGIDLHKVSLGALIISLGLLVDDAIIAVEMMSVKLEEGYERLKAASYAFKITAIPMLSGTLITCSGFIPVAFSSGMAAEFCDALFPVTTSALIISWFAAVMVVPFFGYYIIKSNKNEKKSSRLKEKVYTYFRKTLIFCLTRRKSVLLLTLLLFILSTYSINFVKKEFFPPSLRPEIIVEMNLVEGSSFKATEEEVSRFSEFLTTQQDLYTSYSTYIGKDAPRFVLTLNPELPSKNKAQFVIVAKDVASRKILQKNIEEKAQTDYPNVRFHLKFIQTGPPAKYPVMLQILGEDKEKVRHLANQVADKLKTDKNYKDIHFDWQEKAKILRINPHYEKMKLLGITKKDLSTMIYTQISGASVGEFYDAKEKIAIDLRLKNANTITLADINTLPIFTKAGYVPLKEVADVHFDMEDALIWRKDNLPAITLFADIKEGTANDATKKALHLTEDIQKTLPLGYEIKAAGALADSEKSIKYLLKPVPMMIFIIMTILMLQVKNIKDMILTLLTAPLGIIGAIPLMLLFDVALGFVAELGILALSGMIIRNSVILIDQIQKHKQAGEDAFSAIIDSATLRLRPIMLTAMAAILGMVPLMKNPFWAPMATAIAGGLFIATILTLLVLPTMYASMYKIHPKTTDK